MTANNAKPTSERNDQVGDLIQLLLDLLPDEDEPEEDWPRFDRPLILSIIRALERVPKPRGNSSLKIRGAAKVQQNLALHLLQARKRKYQQQGMSAVEAQWKAAEEDGPAIIKKLTGRDLAPETLRRLMQRSCDSPARIPASNRRYSSVTPPLFCDSKAGCGLVFTHTRRFSQRNCPHRTRSVRLRPALREQESYI